MRCVKQFSLVVEEVTEVCPNWALIAVVDPNGYIAGNGSAFGGVTAAGQYTSFNTAPLAVSEINCSTAVLRLAWTIAGDTPVFNRATTAHVMYDGFTSIALLRSPPGATGSGSAELQFTVPAVATVIYLGIAAGNIEAFKNTVVTITGSVTNDGVPPP